MLNKLLALAFIGLLLGKVFFKPQLRAFARWFDGVINAFIIAIAIVYTVQIILWLTR